MPAAVPIAVAVAAGATAYQGIAANQQAQHAKGAAQAQKTEIDAQVKAAGEADAAGKKNKQQQAGANNSAAMAAVRAAMSASTASNGTILTGGFGAAPASTTKKTLLGA